MLWSWLMDMFSLGIRTMSTSATMQAQWQTVPRYLHYGTVCCGRRSASHLANEWDTASYRSYYKDANGYSSSEWCGSKGLRLFYSWPHTSAVHSLPLQLLIWQTRCSSGGLLPPTVWIHPLLVLISSCRGQWNAHSPLVFPFSPGLLELAGLLDWRLFL